MEKEELKEKKKKRQGGRKLLLLVSIGVIAAAVVFASVFAIEMKRYEKGMMDVYAVQQDGYVRLVVDQINLNQKRSDRDIIKNILETLDSSGSRYWTFSRGEDILFVKNVLETNKYKGLNADAYYSDISASKFVKSLKNGKVQHGIIRIKGESHIASGTIFTYRGKEYRLMLVTDPEILFGNNTYLEAKTAEITILALVLCALVLIPMMLAARCGKLEREKERSAEEAGRLSKALVKLNRIISGRLFESSRNQMNEGEEDDMLYRKYELKFYLNAEHYIIIGGKKGELHPHTWEFALDIGLPKDEFFRFDKVEKKLQEFLEGYQNKVINDIDPFDAILPTIENMTDYFAGEFKKKIEEFDGKLYRVKGAETPTRIYIAEMESTKQEDNE